MTAKYRASVVIELMDDKEGGWVELFEANHSHMSSPESAAQAAEDSLEAYRHTLQRQWDQAALDCSMLPQAVDDLKDALAEVEGMLGDGQHQPGNGIHRAIEDFHSLGDVSPSHFARGSALRRFQREFPGGPYGYSEAQMRHPSQLPPPGYGGLPIIPAQPTSGQPAPAASPTYHPYTGDCCDAARAEHDDAPEGDDGKES